MGKILLFTFSFLLSVVAFCQTPTSLVRVSTSGTAILQNVPKGTILIDMASRKRYLVLLPLTGSPTTTIDGCIKLLLDNKHTSTGASETLAQIKEIGTNSMSHYIGEEITTDAGGISNYGIVVAVWSNGGVEKALLVAETDADAGATSNMTGYVTPVDVTQWRVPTLWELNAVFNSSVIINSILGDVSPNGLSITKYWSSTAGSIAGQNYYKDFATGSSNGISKGTSYRKRYVRTHL